MSKMALLLLLISFSPRQIAAQNANRLPRELQPPGSRIRVAMVDADEPQIVARVGFVRNDSLLLLAEGDSSWSSIPLTRVHTVEARHRSAWRGGVYGAGLGAVGVGGVLGLTQALAGPDTECGGDVCLSRGERASIGFIVGGLLGATLGFLIGTAVGAEHWEAIPVPPVGIIPREANGMAVSVHVRTR